MIRNGISFIVGILSIQTQCNCFNQDCSEVYSSLPQPTVTVASAASAAAAVATASAAAALAAADSSSSSNASRVAKP
jgi:hypothetical protein